MNDQPLHAKVLTVSDGVVHGTREDLSGAALVDQLTAAGWSVVEHRVTADGADNVADALREMCGGFAGLIVTTGGTGFAHATRRRRARAGRSNARRPAWPRRCVWSARSADCPGDRRRSCGQAIICNTPGSPKGCVEQLAAILDVLPHAVRLLDESPTPH